MEEGGGKDRSRLGLGDRYEYGSGDVVMVMKTTNLCKSVTRHDLIWYIKRRRWETEGLLKVRRRSGSVLFWYKVFEPMVVYNT